MPRINRTRQLPTTCRQRTTTRSSSMRRRHRLIQRQRCSKLLQTRTIPITKTTPATRMQVTASPCFRPSSLRHRCRYIRSLRSPAMAIFGPPDIGATLLGATSGYPASGRIRLKWAFCGRPVIGDSQPASIASTTVSGANMSATMAALITDSATVAWAIRADIGTEIVSTTTAPSTT